MLYGTIAQETIAQEQAHRGKISDLPTPDELPSCLGRYQIEALLGRGWMSAAYQAHDTQLDRRVALKVPKFETNTTSRLMDRFYREARSAANLAHPNLCPVFDVGEVDGTHYIAMALIKGGKLIYHQYPALMNASQDQAKGFENGSTNLNNTEVTESGSDGNDEARTAGAAVTRNQPAETTDTG